jgi:LysM repeat protein
MKKILTITFAFCSLWANAQRDKAELYIQQYSEIAMQEMIRTGIPAAIKLAQGILESQSGESNLVKKSNNHFGIKCKPEWTGDRTYHDDDEKGECFRVYPNAEASYRDHSDFLRSRAHYHFLFSLNPADYEAWAYGLKKAGYATSPTYPQKLIKVIKDFNLDRFNALTAERPSNPEKTNSTVPTTSSNNHAAPNNIKQPALTTSTPVASVKDKDIPAENLSEDIETSPQIAKNETTDSKKPIPYPSSVFAINQTKVIYATEGMSLLALANQFGITLSKIMEYNELNNIDILEQDQLIFLEKKQKKGATDYHIVKEGESFYSIAQEEGVRLENILQYNSFAAHSTPTIGNKILLKPISNTLATPNKK